MKIESFLHKLKTKDSYEQKIGNKDNRCSG